MDHLDFLREEIDNIDIQILSLLQQRANISKQVGEYKKNNNIVSLQTGRWEEVLKNRKSIAGQIGLDKDFVVNIWNLIHEYSLNLQK